MMLDTHTQQLYQQMILEHNRTPHNYCRLDDHTHHSEGYNPLCGDHIDVYLRIATEQIEAVSFTGQSCAICKASASMMSMFIRGCTTAEAKSKVQLFQKLLQGENIDRAELGKLLVFATIWHYPSRVKCAALPWHTLRGAIEVRERVSTE